VIRQEVTLKGVATQTRAKTREAGFYQTELKPAANDHVKAGFTGVIRQEVTLKGVATQTRAKTREAGFYQTELKPAA
ncbi:hypothetical protein VS873_23960, partial [Salmonella enterica subsp. enterica serovar Typhi]|nr:hypothetical protein [Salmonella enterica subsp. enterica serovar Typhi]